MKILVINPNTSLEMTEQIERELRKIKRTETILEVARLAKGPLTIESAYDEALAIPELLSLVGKADQENYDALIIACFSDPGLNAAREISHMPVIGIGETSMCIATLLGHKFSIITTLKQRVASKIRYARTLGLESKLASVRSLNIPVIETSLQTEKTKGAILEVAKKAIEEDGAETIILGCAGMVSYSKELERELGAPILDPTSIALKITEAIVDLGMTQSKMGLFAPPPKM